MENYDFSGWATRNDLKCSDGRIIRRDAFKHNDGMKVPMVWNHDHSDPYRVIGHALLENRDEGVYAYGKFNNTDLGQTAKAYVMHGDITALSIYANQLKQQGPNVMHGNIRELSLVLAGANPGAYIENVMAHGDTLGDEARIYTGLDSIVPNHANNSNYNRGGDNTMFDEYATLEHAASDSEETIGDIFETLNIPVQCVVSFYGAPMKLNTTDKNTYQTKIVYFCVDNTGRRGKKDYTIRLKLLEQEGVQIRWADRIENPLGLKVDEYTIISENGDPLDTGFLAIE